MSTDMLSPPIGSPSLRREIEMKRELKMEKEAARSTFQPELSARRGRDNSVKPVGGSRFDRLYNDAIKRKSDESRASIDANNYTFKPTISPKSRSVSRERKPAELFNSLHSASGAGRITVKEAPKDVKLFTPTISKRASSLDRSSSMLDVNARLYAAKKKQQENMEKEKEEAARRHAESCTFSPKLYRSRSASRTRDDDANSGPVAERLLRHGEQMKIKHQDEKALREKEALAEATFKPTIIRRPSFSSDKSDVDVYSRLTQHTEKDKSSMIAELDVELTFQPKISKNHTLPTNETENVHERLFKEAFQKRKDVEEEQRLHEAEEVAKCTFVPNISHHRVGSIAEDASVVTETTPVFDRLSDSKHFMQKILSQIKIDLEMSGCTFQPNLTPKGMKSVRRASEGPVHERLDNDAVRMKQNAQRREEEKLSAEMDGHTFRPHVPESSLDLLRKKTGPESEDGRIHDRLNSAHTVSSLGVTVTGPPSPPPQSSVMDRASVDATVERLLAAGGRHQKQLKASQEERAVEEMKEATFAPSINEKSLKIALKNKDAVRRGSRDMSISNEESSVDTSMLSRTSNSSSRSASAQRRSTFGSRTPSASMYRSDTEINSPSIGSHVQKSTLIERRRESLSEKSADRSKIPILRGGGKPSEPNTPVPVPQADESVSASTSVIIGVAV